VWSPDDGANLQTLVGHTGAVTVLVVGPNGNVYSGSLDRTVRVWSGGNGAPLQTLNTSAGTVFALAVGCDGTLYAGGGALEAW